MKNSILIQYILFFFQFIQDKLESNLLFYKIHVLPLSQTQIFRSGLLVVVAGEGCGGLRVDRVVIIFSCGGPTDLSDALSGEVRVSKLMDLDPMLERVVKTAAGVVIV